MGKIEDSKDWLKWKLWGKYGFNLTKQIKDGSIAYNRHLYVCGLSGMGKTTLIHRLLQEKADIPFLAVEPTQSRQYRILKSLRTGTRPFYIYSIGEDNGNGLNLNPFYIPYGMDFIGHIDLLKSCFSAAIKTMTNEPLVYQYIERAIPEIYYDKGWDRSTHQNKRLTFAAYDTEEHFFYFPRMQDLYDKVVEFCELSEFSEGGENKGTIRELVKSNVRFFMSETCGRTFNTYKNDLYKKLDMSDIVLEIPNVANTSLPAILNILLGIIIEIIGQRKSDGQENCRHITVLEEAHLLFPAEHEDKTPNGAAKKLEQLLSTARKFKEAIIITNQDPTAIHQSVLGNIRQRFIFKINSSEIAKQIATDYNIKETDLVRLPMYKFWFCRDHNQHKAIKYVNKEIEYRNQQKDNTSSREVKLQHSQSVEDLILTYAGLDNINEQIGLTLDFMMAMAHTDNQALEVQEFSSKLSALIKQCNIEEINKTVMPEYMAFLTCIAVVKMQKNLYSKSYSELKAYYEHHIGNLSTDVKLPKILSFPNCEFITLTAILI